MSTLTNRIDQVLEAWQTGRGFSQLENTIYLLKKYKELAVFHEDNYHKTMMILSKIEKKLK